MAGFTGMTGEWRDLAAAISKVNKEFNKEGSRRGRGLVLCTHQTSFIAVSLRIFIYTIQMSDGMISLVLMQPRGSSKRLLCTLSR